jgi:hypothetical protein
VYTKGSPNASKESEACRSGVAQVWGNRAQIALEQKRLADARRLYADAETALRGLVKDFPLSVTHRLELAACLFWQGVLLHKEDAARGRALVDEAIALLDAENTARPNEDVRIIRDQYIDLRQTLLKPPEKK